MPLKVINIRAPWQLLPPFPLPYDEDDPLHVIEHDDGDLDPKHGVSGHVPLDMADRLGFCLFCKLTSTLLFVGLLSSGFLSSWLPGCSGVGEEDDEDVPGSPCCS